MGRNCASPYASCMLAGPARSRLDRDQVPICHYVLAPRVACRTFVPVWGEDSRQWRGQESRIMHNPGTLPVRFQNAAKPLPRSPPAPYWTRRAAANRYRGPLDGCVRPANSRPAIARQSGHPRESVGLTEHVPGHCRSPIDPGARLGSAVIGTRDAHIDGSIHEQRRLGRSSRRVHRSGRREFIRTWRPTPRRRLPRLSRSTAAAASASRSCFRIRWY